MKSTNFKLIGYIIDRKSLQAKGKRFSLELWSTLRL